jgi:hypothetical protein
VSARGVALGVGVAAALAVDAYAYATLPQMRSLIAREHWIFYGYLSAIVALATGGAALAVAWLAARLSWPTRS